MTLTVYTPPHLADFRLLNSHMERNGKETSVGPKDAAATLLQDDRFSSALAASDFYKRKDRSRLCDMGEASGIRSISWSISGSHLACSSSNFLVAVGNLDPHSCRLKPGFVGVGHRDSVEAVEFSKQDENLFASASSDRTVRLWDVREPPKRHTVINTREANLFLAWSNGGRMVAYGDKTDNVSLLDVRVANKLLESVSYKDEVNEMAFHPSDDYLFLTTGGGRVEIMSTPNLKRVKTIQAHPPLSSCTSIAFSPNERCMAVGGSDACCSIWDMRDLICTNSLTRLDYPVRTLSWSFCSSLVATGSEDRVIDVAWATTGEKVAEVPIAAECFAVRWHPRLYLLAYATGSGATVDGRPDPVTLRIFGFS